MNTGQESPDIKKRISAHRTKGASGNNFQHSLQYYSNKIQNGEKTRQFSPKTTIQKFDDKTKQITENSQFLNTFHEYKISEDTKKAILGQSKIQMANYQTQKIMSRLDCKFQDEETNINQEMGQLDKFDAKFESQYKIKLEQHEFY